MWFKPVNFGKWNNVVNDSKPGNMNQNSSGLCKRLSWFHPYHTQTTSGTCFWHQQIHLVSLLWLYCTNWYHLPVPCCDLMVVVLFGHFYVPLLLGLPQGFNQIAVNRWCQETLTFNLALASALTLYWHLGWAMTCYINHFHPWLSSRLGEAVQQSCICVGGSKGGKSIVDNTQSLCLDWATLLRYFEYQLDDFLQSLLELKEVPSIQPKI